MANVKLARFIQLVNQQSLAPVSYNRGLLAVIEGRIPATLKGERWFVDDAAVLDAVEYFAGVTLSRRRA